MNTNTPIIATELVMVFGGALLFGWWQLRSIKKDQQKAARQKLLEAAVVEAGAGTAFSLMPMVLASFLRLVTSPKIFRVPTPIVNAMAFIDALSAAPGVQVAHLGPEWPTFRRLCLDRQLAGNDLPDAWLAAAVDFLGEHLVSFDRDFRKLLGRGQLTLLAPESP